MALQEIFQPLDDVSWLHQFHHAGFLDAMAPAQLGSGSAVDGHDGVAIRITTFHAVNLVTFDLDELAFIRKLR